MKHILEDGPFERLKTENEKLLAALTQIAQIEPGSRGAYAKFAMAQRIAKAIIEPSTHKG